MIGMRRPVSLRWDFRRRRTASPVGRRIHRPTPNTMPADSRAREGRTTLGLDGTGISGCGIAIPGTSGSPPPGADCTAGTCIPNEVSAGNSVSDDQPVRSVRVAGHKGHLARLGYGEGASIGIVNGKDGMWVGEALTDEDADLCRSRDPPGDSPLWSLRRRQNDRGEQPGVLDRGGYQVPLSELPEVFEDLPCRPRPIVRVFGQRARDKAYALVIEDVVQASDIPGRRGAWPRGQAAEDG
jgi:hypothetical protein